MTRQFVAFATQLAVINGVIVGMLYVLGVSPYYLKLAMAIGVGVLALSALIVALSNMPFRRRSGSPDNDARAAYAAQRGRTRILLRRFATFLRDLRRTQPRFRLWYREPRSAPWWLVLGPGGHGKSSLLLAAHQAREHAPPDPSSREPRFFSAPGLAFLELPEDAADHPGFLRLLRRIARKRPTQPIAGILVVHRIDTLGDSPELLARTRAQILQITGELAVRPPVVLAFTHLDRLAGYAEFCDALVHPQSAAGLAGPPAPTNLADPLGRPLGVTITACDSAGAVARALQARLADPLAWVRQRCHALVARPRIHDQQRHIYSFWQHLEQLAERSVACASFLAALPLPGGESLPLRSVYFLASTTNTDPPGDAWLDRLAARAGGSVPVASSPVQPPPQAFVRGLFATELLRDSPLAARLRLFRWRRTWIHSVLAVATASFAVYVTVAVTRAAEINHTYMQQTWNAARDAFHVSARKAAPAAPLDVLRNTARHWRSPELGHDWGLSRGDFLADASTVIFTRSVCTSVLLPIARRSEDAMRQFAAQLASTESVPNTRVRDEILGHLHLYVLLSEPTRAHDPWQGNEFAWLSEHVRRAWAEDDGGSETTRADVLASHAEFVAGGAELPDPADPCTSTRGALALPHDPELVTTVSRILQRLPSEKYTLEKILADIDKDRTLTRVDLGSPQIKVPASMIHARFTFAGWRRVSAAIREGETRGASTWFLHDDQAAEARHERCLKLRDLYVDRYIDAWKHAIHNYRIKRSAELSELQAVFHALRADNPLRDLFAAVDEHTQRLPPIHCLREGPPEEPWTKKAAVNLGLVLPDPPPSPASFDQRDAPDVIDHFAQFVDYGIAATPLSGDRAAAAAAGKLALQTYHDYIAALGQQLKAADQNREQIPGLLRDTRNARTEILAKLDQGEYGRWSDELKDILVPPLDDLIFLLDDTVSGETNKSWCLTVVIPLRDLLHSYPFDRESRSHAALADISRLFHPETGKIAEFRDAQLSGLVETADVGVTARALGVDAERRINGSVVNFLDDAHKLGRLLHPGDAAGLDLAVELTCQAKISKVILTVDGTATDYDCSIKRPKSIHWPGEKAPHATNLEAHGNNGGKDAMPSAGQFSLLKLIEQRGAPQRFPGSHRFSTTFQFGKFGPLKLSFNPQTVQGGSLLYGFSDDPRFLAPFRTPTILAPPESLFQEHAKTCSEAPR